MSDALNNRLGGERISSRQIDELIGLARGVAADGSINQAEVEFLQKWLAGNVEITGHPLVRTLYRRVNEMLSDGIIDEDEKAELLDTLNRFSSRDFELGEVLKATTLPLCNPAPMPLAFEGLRYTFTGTFNYGKRKDCEAAVVERGADVGSLTAATNVLVIGVYATDSWKHSSFGNKILKACELRDRGHPISIVAEEHWTRHL
ncbi:NAD-dependent DNA ligase [Aurantimonas aggregata]|uniref:NAD-dependent DNA ligase n=1 Tax=Aurantimonas aggregata TaxID=2047720 RepID=A0A6L9MLV8_9HYPH|nr:BRCT domain-containing protein [Aurantimonas aggregata]NDV88833.1 NAD-dependent DNA ligase [Aurantimonas aggregata]